MVESDRPLSVRTMLLKLVTKSQNKKLLLGAEDLDDPKGPMKSLPGVRVWVPHPPGPIWCNKNQNALHLDPAKQTR